MVGVSSCCFKLENVFVMVLVISGAVSKMLSIIEMGYSDSIHLCFKPATAFSKSIFLEHNLRSLYNWLLMIPAKQCLGCAELYFKYDFVDVSFLCSRVWMVLSVLYISKSKKVTCLSTFSVTISLFTMCVSVSQVKSKENLLKCLRSVSKNERNSSMFPDNMPPQSSINLFHNFIFVSKLYLKSSLLLFSSSKMNARKMFASGTECFPPVRIP